MNRLFRRFVDGGERQFAVEARRIEPLGEERRRGHDHRRTVAFDQSFPRQPAKYQRHRFACRAHQLAQESIPAGIEDDRSVITRERGKRAQSYERDGKPLLNAECRELAQFVEQRLLATLIRMAANDTFTRADGRIVLCSARYRLLCELVGATRESVSLVLGRLTGEGLVERDGSSMIVASPSLLAERLDAASFDGELPFPAIDEAAEQAVH